MTKNENKIAIIGGGASGIMAAITAARSGASVIIYEHKDSLANKILITGNGKCNFSNLRMESSCFHSSTDKDGRTGRILDKFSVKDCIDFFESIGVRHRERKGGIYPYTDTAEAVRSALLLELKSLDVSIVCDCGKLVIGDDRSILADITESDRRKKRAKRQYDRIIISCGGCVSPKTGSDGSGYELLRSLDVPLTPIYPALTPLIVKEDLSLLKGIRCDARLCLLREDGSLAESSSGELQPYDKGLSGICAMDISGQACRIMGDGKRAYAEVDFFPVMTDDEFKAELNRRIRLYPERKLNELLTGLFAKKLINYLVHPIDTRRDGYIDKLCDNVKHHRYELSPEMLKDFSRAQTIAGGVPLSAVDDNCMLYGHEGIYVAGELLDSDGVCGGYNLHFAWATGMLAGCHAAGS